MAKKKPRNGSKPPPICKAILLCDDIIVDAYTGKTTIVGVFDNLYFEDFPSVTPPIRFYVQLNDGLGKYAISLEVNDLRTGEIIGQVEVAEVDFSDRPSKAHLLISVEPLHLAHAGAYDVVVLADGQEVDRQQFHAIQNNGEAFDESEEEEPPGWPEDS